MLSCQVGQVNRLEMKTFRKSWVCKWGTLPLWRCPSPRASGKFANGEKKTYRTLDMLSLVQSLQSKEKKEKSERKITALLMGKLQVNQNHFKCPVVCLTFWAHTDRELKGQHCANLILFCSGRYALPGQAGSSPSVAGDAKISDIWITWISDI